MGMFEYAIRNKLRFKHSKGNLNVEDLWDLNKVELNDIYIQLEKERNSTSSGLIEEDSKAAKKNEGIDIGMKIVRYIFEKKVEEEQDMVKKEAARQQKQEIMKILEEKEKGSLREKSEDELKEMLKQLD